MCRLAMLRRRRRVGVGQGVTDGAVRNRADAHALLLDLEDVQSRLRGRLRAPPEGDGDREVSRRAGAMLFLDCIVETRRSVERAWPGLGRESLDAPADDAAWLRAPGRCERLASPDEETKPWPARRR
jgi:hypothetical protein